jgi:hypothetical protein
MKKLVLLFAFVGLVLFAYAQSWAPAGASWHFSYMQMLSYGYIKIEYTGDTTIQSKNCKMLQKTIYGFSYPGNYDTIQLTKEYTYSDSNVVYYYEQGQFDTLYAFNLQPGDSWKVRNNSPVDDSGKVVVDSIGFEIINSDTLRAIFVSPAPGSCVGWYAGSEIVERIGCINGYMLPDNIDCVMDANEGGPFRCYSDDNFALYQVSTANPCDFITNIIDNSFNENNIIAYPSPTADKLTIETPTHSTIQILNIHGQLIKTIAASDTKTNVDHVGWSSCVVNVSALPAGVYIVEVRTEKGIAVRKFVKE